MSTAASSRPDERRRAAAVAAVARALADRAGVALGPDLALWGLAGADPGAGAAGAGDPPGGADPAGALGAALEAATDGGRRRVQGLHVTPRWLADHLAGLALAGAGAGTTVCDPACGGGAFLVAAAEQLRRRGADPRHVVRHLVWGADIDPVGLATAEAALALWAGEAPPPGRLVVGDPLVAGRDLWADAPPAGFGAVVGNPPFQGQLGRSTARSARARARLRARYGEAVRPYTDTAWLFLVLGCDLAAPGGRVVLVEPQSVIGARDAAAVRRAVDTRAELRELWADGGRVFAASVRVCAPVLVRRPGTGPAPAPAPAADRWADLWADAQGVPRLPAVSDRTLGERAEVMAGFRDEYYGLAAAVREHDPADPPGEVGPLVTSGALGWASCSWADTPVRFAKRAWRAPVVDLGRLPAVASPTARRWVARTRGPKVVVASQTRVVEAAVDAAGTWVPSVPALAVVPRQPADLWPLAAALLAPAASAWLARRSAGTGLDRGALRVRAADLAALPLPVDDRAWAAATAALRRLVDGGGAPDGGGALDAFVAAAGDAYGAPGATLWWRARNSTRPARGGGG